VVASQLPAAVVPAARRPEAGLAAPHNLCPARVSSSGLCENFLYGFKAARRAARAANSARSPLLPLALPQRRRLTPVGWREELRPPGRLTGRECSSPRQWTGLAGVGSYREQVCSRTWHCPARPEPVKSAYGVGSADLRLFTEPARKPRRWQLSEAWARVAGGLLLEAQLSQISGRDCR
jgi:hypothetical protein